jgi:hypothetical protein
VLVVATIGLAGLFGLASKLKPDPRGFGTHEQIGLRSCMFRTVTGRPCPTCGMTTAYAWLVRGRLDRSWRSNPAGCVLALFSVPLMVWLGLMAAANRPIGSASLSRPLFLLLFAAVALSVASWLIRLIVSPAVPDPPGALTPVASAGAPGW